MVRLVITNRGSRIVLKLSVPNGQAEGVMVSSWHPCNAGVMVWKKFVRIGPMPAPVGGMSDITRQYVKKHGKPEVGQRVFIRTKQYLDCGPEDWFLETSAIVPAKEAGGGPATEG